MFVQWCDENNLILNTGKTKELIIDFRIKKAPVTPVLIKGEAIEIVDSYKYLGDILTSNNSYNLMIEARISAVRGITAELNAILSEIPEMMTLNAVISYSK